MHYLIVTHNRREALRRLVEQIYATDKNAFITLLDDKSNYDVYNDFCSFDNLLYVKNFERRGKERFWETLTTLFKTVLNSRQKYFVVLPDDCLLVEDFQEKILQAWEGITEEKKVINVYTDVVRYKQSIWTGIKPKNYNSHVYLANWTEQAIFCEKDVFEALEYKINPIPDARWEKDPNLSSGVGQQISTRLLQKHYKIFNGERSFIFMQDDAFKSKMNPNRKRLELNNAIL